MVRANTAMERSSHSFHIDQHPILTEREAAGYLRVSVSTMRRRGYVGSGPRFLQDGYIVRYRKSWLDDYVEGSRRGASSSAPEMKTNLLVGPRAIEPGGGTHGSRR